MKPVIQLAIKKCIELYFNRIMFIISLIIHMNASIAIIIGLPMRHIGYSKVLYSSDSSYNTFSNDLLSCNLSYHKMVPCNYPRQHKELHIPSV
jgi:hypothetical protein